jgi:Zn-dependent peptidase ImmA (M78 family)
MRAPDIAEQYNVSEQMAAFRLRTTGVLRQLGASGE